MSYHGPYVIVFVFVLRWYVVRMHPITSFELLFFAVFGQTTTEQTQVDKILNVAEPTQPYWVEYLFKIVFGIYMLVSVVVLINLLIAMMSDTYQRIQVVFFCFAETVHKNLTSYYIHQYLCDYEFLFTNALVSSHWKSM